MDKLHVTSRPSLMRVFPSAGGQFANRKLLQMGGGPEGNSTMDAQGPMPMSEPEGEAGSPEMMPQDGPDGDLLLRHACNVFCAI